MKQILPAVFLLWAGLLIGVSFVATPAKFLAPSLPLAQALDVGRSTFHVLAWIEWGLVIVTGLFLAMRWIRATECWALASVLLLVVAGVLAVQTLLVRPVLDARVTEIMGGGNVLPSAMHASYVGLEAAKVLLLLAAGACCLRGMPSRNP